MSLYCSNSAPYEEGHPKKIMLIDDEPSILLSAERCLKNSRYDIYTFENAEDAIESAKHQAFDLIIADQRMPKLSGVEVLTRIRLMQPECVTIILSGFNDSQSLMAAINRAHIYRYITKPWNDIELITAVEQALCYGEQQAQTHRLADRARVSEGSMTRHQACLRELENKYPGITDINRDENGAIILRGQQ